MLRILDAVLDDPLDKGGVEVTGDHAFFRLLFIAVAELPGIGGTGGAETEFLLELAADLHDQLLIHAVGDLEMQAGIDGFDRFSKPQHDRLGVGRHGEKTGENAIEDQQADDRAPNGADRIS